MLSTNVSSGAADVLVAAAGTAVVGAVFGVESEANELRGKGRRAARSLRPTARVELVAPRAAPSGAAVFLLSAAALFGGKGVTVGELRARLPPPGAGTA